MTGVQTCALPICHFVLGAAIVGLALDVWQPRRFLALPILLLFIVGIAWASANGGLMPRIRPDGVVLAGFLAMNYRALAAYRFRAPIATVVQGKLYRPFLQMSSQGASIVLGFTCVTAFYIWYEGGSVAIEECDDPMIRFARMMDKHSRALRERYEKEFERDRKSVV